ncbi:MAG: prepilin peptidase [Lachnospiraceae bacterium]|nr:prepilin peptidase [Lachnospiraceae bacterium]
MVTEYIREGLLLIFLITGTIADIRKRSIPVLLFLIFGIAGVVLFMLTGSVTLTDEIFGILLGIVFVALSHISDGKIGAGDGIAILVSGIFLGGSRAACQTLYGMLGASLISILLLMVRRGNRNTALPFLPFLLTGYLMDKAGGLL